MSAGTTPFHLLLWIVWAVAVCVRTASAAPSVEENDFLQVETADAAVNKILALRDMQIKTLVRVLDDETLPQGSRVRAVWGLGQLRASQTTPALLRHIDLEAVDYDLKIKIARWNRYPVTGALTAIGRPVLSQLMGKLTRENSELRRRLMCIVLHDLEGSDCGRVRLRDATRYVTNDVEQANLDAAVAEFERLVRPATTRSQRLGVGSGSR